MRRFGLLAALAVVLAGCGGGGHDVTAGQMESAIRPSLQKQLRHRLGDRSILVNKLDCVKKRSGDGSCLATVSDSSGTEETVGIAVDVDPDTGNVIWHVQSS